jgi:enoyl-CoA hydratase
MQRRLRYGLRDGIGSIQLDDGKANAIQSDWCEQMQDVLDEAEADGSRALVLQGRERFFSGGLDLRVLPLLPADELLRTTDLFMRTMRRIFLFPKPLVAASAGHAIAGGMMLYLAADIRIALDDHESLYGLNEATTGIPLAGGTAGICQSSIPPAHHTELILHGRLISAAETHARGISHELVSSPDALLERAHARAEELGRLDPAAYRINKKLLREPVFEAAAAAAAVLTAELPTQNVFAGLAR